MSNDSNKYKFKIIAANKDGSRIFCKLTYDNKNILRGFYDFNIEKFIIIKYMYENFPTNLTKTQVRKNLKHILLIDFDWNL